MMSVNPLWTHKVNLLGIRSLHSRSDEDTLNWSLSLHDSRTSKHAEDGKDIVMEDAVPRINATMRKSICGYNPIFMDLARYLVSQRLSLEVPAPHEDKRYDYR